jgi:hypothetical protein
MTRENSGPDPREMAQIQWESKGLRAERVILGSGATIGATVEVQRDVVSVAGWVAGAYGGRRVAWRLELYADRPLPIESARVIGEAILGRLEGMAQSIDAVQSLGRMPTSENIRELERLVRGDGS